MSEVNFEIWITIPFVHFTYFNEIFQVLNVALGYVRSNLMVTFLQVMSRVIVVCGVLWATPTAPLSYGLPMLLIAWSVTEVIRYSFYALNIIGAVPYLLIWCRYELFYFIIQLFF